MAGALERWSGRSVAPMREQALAHNLAMNGMRNQADVALAAVECAAFVAYRAQAASQFVHMSADLRAARVPSCADGVELIAQTFDLGAAQRVASVFNGVR